MLLFHVAFQTIPTSLKGMTAPSPDTLPHQPLILSSVTQRKQV